MVVTFDKEADAAYIHLARPSPGSVAQSVPCFDAPREVVLDFNRDGRLIVVEVLGASKGPPRELLAQAVLPGDVLVNR